MKFADFFGALVLVVVFVAGVAWNAYFHRSHGTLGAPRDTPWGDPVEGTVRRVLRIVLLIAAGLMALFLAVLFVLWLIQLIRNGGTFQ